jgi:molybdenum cofactor cytidylyltransferase
MPDIFSCALLLLAAGGSSRMGRPKQLLPIGNRPLLRYVVEASRSPFVAPVIVALGANVAEIRPCLNGLPARVVVNQRWVKGLGASARDWGHDCASHRTCI